LVTTISRELDPARDEDDLKRRGAEFDSIVDVHVLPTDEVADALGAFARRFPAPLFCIASHARTALGELVFGSASAAILRAGHLPAAVLGPHATVSSDAVAKHLLVCVDEFAVRQPLLEDADSWVATFGGDVEIFEAVDDLRGGPSAARPSALVRMADGLGPTAATTAVASRDPATAIIEEAARRPGTVIAMASHLRHGLDRLARGSTASEVIRRHDGLVLVVPSPVAARS
jgi:nucleotide-binding universal stress UspA family protein